MVFRTIHLRVRHKEKAKTLEKQIPIHGPTSLLIKGIAEHLMAKG
jgi:hypothetical protein